LLAAHRIGSGQELAEGGGPRQGISVVRSFIEFVAQQLPRVLQQIQNGNGTAR